MSSNVKINCPECGKVYFVPMAALGKRTTCKACGQPFAALAPIEPSVGNIVENGPSHKPKRWLMPTLTSAVALALGTAGGFLWGKEQRDSFKTDATAASEKASEELRVARAEAEASKREAEAARAELSKATAKPEIPEDVRTHLIALVAKCSKLQTYTEQAASYKVFMEHYGEVKSAAESVDLLGWPEKLQAEERMMKLTIEAWELGRSVWETKLGLADDPNKQLQFNLNVVPVYGDRLKGLAARVTKATSDASAANKLDEILKADGGRILADFAVRWSFLAATQPFERLKESIKAKIKR